MPKIALIQAAYESRSIIASAQRCINLYPEKNPEDAPFPLTHYLTPGIDILSSGSSTPPYGATGSILDGSITAGGTAYTNGVFLAQSLTGGTGSGAKADITVVGGIVISVTLRPTLFGSGYAEGDVLSAGLAGGSGFTWTVASITSATNNVNPVRCTFRTSSGLLYVVIGATVYYVDPAFVLTSLGAIEAGTTPVSMQDNGLVVLIADGTNDLYSIDISSGAPGTFAEVTDPNIYGADRVDYADTFFVLNVPGTNQWYISLSEVNAAMLSGVAGSILTGSITAAGTGGTNGTYTGASLTGGTGSGGKATIVITGNAVTSVTITTPGTGYVVGDVLSASSGSISGFTWTVGTVGGTAFDPLDIATKSGYPDAIQGIIVMHREIWIIGTLTTEIWYNAGAADFTFQVLPGTFIEHGTIAKYSICKQDLSVYWVSQDEQGRAIIIKGSDYQAKRISTFAVENAIAQYNTASDCIGFTYQQDGHTFVVFSFPSGNATWVYDESMQLWHERVWTDNNGNLNRHRMQLGCNAYNKNVVGDWQNGNLYALNINTAVDNVDGLGDNTDGSYPISRIRSFPALVEEGKRISYKNFTADIEVGTSTYPSTSPPMISLRSSDDRGRTYGNKLEQSMGAQGQYLTQPKWSRLGLSRGRVFELSWSIGGPTALNGAWTNVEMAGS